MVKTHSEALFKPASPLLPHMLSRTARVTDKLLLMAFPIF